MYKFTFMIIMIFSIIMTINSNNLMFSWMMMELNLISFIPMLINKNFIKMNIKAMINYFLIQSFSSSIFMMSILMNFMSMNFELLLMFKSLLIMCMLIKLGFFPFHFWFLKMMNLSNWKNCFILSIIQKIIPMWLLINFNAMSMMLIIFNIINSLFSTFMGLNQSLIKMIMSFSSMNHISWIMIISMFHENMFFFYVMIYSIINFSLMYMYLKFNILLINNIYKMNFYYKILLSLLILSLGSLPPFSGFFLKWLFSSLLKMNFSLIFTFMIFMINSSITLFYYFYIFIPLILNKNNLFNKLKYNSELLNINMYYSFLMLMFNNMI